MSRVPATERRLQLIEAAVRVISREGTAGATTRRIALEAGAPLATLHYNFRGKEDLFHAVLEHCQVLAKERLREHRASDGGLRASVRALIDQFREWTIAEPEFQVAQYELLFWARRTPSAQALAPQVYEDYHALIRALLAEAATDEDDAAAIDRLSSNVIAVTDGMLLQIIALGADHPAVASVDQLTEVALAGVATPAA